MVHIQIEDLEIYAREHKVPIMLKSGIEFLVNYIKEHNIKRILEIGTAIGYSSIKMAMVDSDISITTIERDSNMYECALKNIEKFGLNRQINVIFNDALDVEINDQYDLIFIDAAKSQYIKFFNKFKNNLAPNGVIVTDNLSFHGLVNDSSNCSRNTKQLVRKIQNYIDFLKNNREFKTEFFDLGDGVSISKKD